MCIKIINGEKMTDKLQETSEERIARLEQLGYLDPNCKTCVEIFYPAYKHGYMIVFTPSHKPSRRCESGKRPHCTCDVCF